MFWLSWLQVAFVGFTIKVLKPKLLPTPTALKSFRGGFLFALFMAKLGYDANLQIRY
jgi:hypothetical protein